MMRQFPEGESRPPDVSTQTPPPPPPRQEERSKKRPLLWYILLILALVIIALFVWWLFWRMRNYTDDAYVEGNQVYITPLIDGFVTAIHSDDTFLVRQGTLLVELDDTDAQIALNTAKEELARVVRDVCGLFHQVFVQQAQVASSQAEWIKAAQDFQHRLDVIDIGGVSLEDYEHAVAELRTSFFSYKSAQQQYKKAMSLVQGTSVWTHPWVLAAADELRNAWVKFYRCRIYAPVDGLVAQRTIQVGMWVPAGKPLMSVIPLDQIWVNTNFKETQMKHMRIGQPVRLTSDLYGRGVVYHGRIVGLPGAAGNAFSLLPPQNLSGNWIKIVQRLPVRVALDPNELRAHPLRIGLSMEAWADFGAEGPLVPTTVEGPTYATAVFMKEEQGDQLLIDQIIGNNIDPAIASYAQHPI